MKESDPSASRQALSTHDAAGIAQSLKPIEPSADRAAQLKSRILHGIRSGEVSARTSTQDPQGLLTIAAQARKWSRFTPGVEICVLREDERRRTALFRMQPGSVLFPHHHDMSEESIVLEGTAIIGDDTHIEAGDYQFAPAGSRHDVISSPTGCTVLVRGERRPRARVDFALLSRLVRYFGQSAR